MREALVKHVADCLKRCAMQHIPAECCSSGCCSHATHILILYKRCNGPTSARTNDTQAHVQEHPTRAASLHHCITDSRPQCCCGQHAAASWRTLLDLGMAITAVQPSVANECDQRWDADCDNHKHQLPSLSQPPCKQLSAIRQLACKERSSERGGASRHRQPLLVPTPTASTCCLPQHAGVSRLCQFAAARDHPAQHFAKPRQTSCS
jgi:hypothetical protein